MRESHLEQRMQSLTASALREYHATRSAVEDLSAQAPSPGEIFLLPKTAAFPLEWGLIVEHPDVPGRFLAVPADTHPRVGSADCEIPADAPCGPLVLRCGFAVWLEAEDLDLRTCTCRLKPEHLRAAQQRWQELERGTLSPSASERQTDADPDYQDWSKDVLAKAHSLLSTRPPESTAGSWHGRRLSKWSGLLSQTGRVAASILLLLTSMSAAGLLWQQRRIHRLLTERDHRAVTHRQEIKALEARLQVAGEPQPLVNLPLLWLTPRLTTRGPPKRVRIPPASERLQIVLEVRDPSPYPEYSLEILDQATKREVWRREGLRKGGTIELSIVLPSRLLPPGEYQLILRAQKAGQLRPIAEYGLKVDSI